MSLGLAIGSLILAAANVAPGVSYRVWTVEDGLPQNLVFGLAQSPDGYLWIATLDGLVRYDGVRMRTFNRAENPDLPSNRFLAAYVDRRGDLWLGTEDGGAVRLQGNRFRTYGTSDGLPSVSVESFFEDRDGRLWVGTPSGHVRRDGDRFVADPEASSREGREPFAVFDGGVMRRYGPEGTFLEFLKPPSRPIPPFAYSSPFRGAMAIRTGDDLHLIGDRGSETVGGPPLDDPEVQPPRYAVLTDSGGRLWLVMRGRVSVRDGGRWTVLPPIPGFRPCPTKMLEDREGSIWVAGETGLLQIRTSPIRVESPPGDALSRTLFPIAEGADGTIWMGSRGSAWRFGGGRYEVLDAAHRVFDVVRAILPERDGSVLMASDGGPILRVNPDRRVEVLPGVGAAVTSMIRDRRGALWIGGEGGVVRRDRSGDRRFGASDGLPHDRVTVLREGRDGAIWVGTYGGLGRITDAGVEGWTERDGLSSNRIRALHEDDEGKLWIGTYDNGLTRLDRGRFVAVRKRDGLGDDGAFAILDDGLGRLWISSNRGIYVVQRAELDAFADGKLRAVTSRRFGSADGMRSAECNGGFQPAGIRRRDGTLWFPTQDGAVVVDPRALVSNPVRPNVVVEGISTEHRTIPLGASVVLSPTETRLEVRFAVPTFVRPEQARFRYRLDKLDDAWNEGTGERVARYAYVPPGRYTLRIDGANSDGVWSEHGAVVEVEVQPTIWRTGWVRAVVAIAVLGAVVAGFRARIRALKRRRAEQDAFARKLLESQEAERKRIASELHDGIGQTLVVIRNRALLGMNERADRERAKGELGEISEAAAVGIEEVRKVAYNLRPYQLDRLGLKRAIEAVVEEVAASSGIAIEGSVGAIDGVFAPGDEIHVYRLVQEGLGNVVRHSGATRARVSVTMEPSEVRIEIEDDGRGFDPEGARAGLGLSGMAERARILGGSHALRTSPGSGTRVSVVLPRSGAGS